MDTLRVNGHKRAGTSMKSAAKDTSLCAVITTVHAVMRAKYKVGDTGFVMSCTECIAKHRRMLS